MEKDAIVLCNGGLMKLQVLSFLHTRALECFPLRVAIFIHHTHLPWREVRAIEVDRSIVNAIAIVTRCIFPDERRT